MSNKLIGLACECREIDCERKLTLEEEKDWEILHSKSFEIRGSTLIVCKAHVQISNIVLALW